MPSLIDGTAGDAYVSTGELPERELVDGPPDLPGGPIVNVSVRQDQIALRDV
jgi:hypothetical protein